MRSKDYAYLLGVVAIFAGLAIVAFGSSRLIDLFGGAVVLSGLGATGWVAWGRRFLRIYIGVLLATVLIGAVVFLTDLMSRIDAHALTDTSGTTKTGTLNLVIRSGGVP